MNMMKSLITTAFALAALSAASTAQQQVQQFDSVQQHGYMELDLATGVSQRAAQDDKCGLVTAWANSDYSGYYSVPGPGGMWLTWGVLGAAPSDIVGQFYMAYATTLLDTAYGGPGGSLCLHFYDDILGGCADSGLGLLPDASFCFSGLKGGPDGVTAWGWTYSVTLTGGFEFTQDAGPFGYAMSFFDSSSGPLLYYSGSANNGVGPDSNGQNDRFDWYVPDVASGTCGTYWFGGYPNNFSSWRMTLNVGDGVPTASCSWYCGTGANAATDGFVITSPAVLGGTFGMSVTHCMSGNIGALVVAYDSPLTFMTKWGEILINFTSPNGELIGMPAGIGNPATITLPVPINMLFCGFGIYVQAASFGGGICLHCAYNCVIGF
jgi:hypothetical protein